VIGDGIFDMSVMIAGRTDIVNNYQEETLKELLKNVKVRCIECESEMIRVIDLYDNTIVGYSCKNCSHYNLLNNNPV